MEQTGEHIPYHFLIKKNTSLAEVERLKDRLDGTFIPEQWGKPGSSYAGNFNNSIFALLGGYNTEGYNHPSYGSEESNFSIRTLWNASTKILTIGWYNLGSGYTTVKIQKSI